MKLTEEQQKVVESKDEITKVVAYAGTGKTSTLVALSQANPVNSLYLAFNKSVAVASEQKFPKHVRCSTIHSLAYREIGRTYTLGKLYAWKLSKEHRINLHLATLIILTLENYLNSAETDIELVHVPLGLDNRPLPESMARIVVEWTVKIWKLMVNRDKNYPMTHSGYLKLYQLSKPRLRYRMILLDEAQDTNPVTKDIVMRQADFARIIMVGDPFQQIYCQPFGTLVTVPSKPSGKNPATVFKSVPIEQLTPGDAVVSYNIASGYGCRTGQAVSSVRHLDYDGPVITVTAGNFTSTYTPQHHCVVRTNLFIQNCHFVYLMRRGTNFRIGRTSGRFASQNNAAGISLRLAQEKGDALWVISSHKTKQEAAAAEATVAWTYALPTLNFVAQKNHLMGQTGLNQFWKNRNNMFYAEKLLRDIGRDIRFPLIQRPGKNLLNRRTTVVAACNLMEGMSMLTLDQFSTRTASGRRMAKSTWTPITVKTAHYTGKIASLEIQKDHTYFGDGILTHNSWRGAVDAMQSLDCPQYLLTRSWRFGPQIAEAATSLLRAFYPGIPPIIGNGPEGLIGPLPGNVPPTIITRTNMGLFSCALDWVVTGGIHVVGGGRGGLQATDYIRDLYALWSARDIWKIKDQQLRALESYDVVEEMIESNCADAEMILGDRLIDHYGHQLPEKIELVENALTEADKASVILSTTHKAKGMEWDYVSMHSDFCSLYDQETGELRKLGFDTDMGQLHPEELNLIYVAATRARLTLDPVYGMLRLLGIGGQHRLATEK